MKLRPPVLPIVCFLFLPLFSACTTVEKLPPVLTCSSEKAMEARSVSILFSNRFYYNGKEDEFFRHPHKYLELWHNQILNSYCESGLFSEVRKGLVEADFRAEVIFIYWREVKGSCQRTVFLPFLSPKGTDKYVLKTTIKGKNGDILGKFEISRTKNIRVNAYGMRPDIPIVIDLSQLNHEIINQAVAECLFVADGS